MKYTEISLKGDNVALPNPLHEVMIIGENNHPNKGFIDSRQHWWVYDHNQKAFINPNRNVVAPEMLPKAWLREDKEEAGVLDNVLNELAHIHIASIGNPHAMLSQWADKFRFMIKALEKINDGYTKH